MNPQTEVAQTEINQACYTASRIAAAAGMSKRGVLYALKGIPPASALIVSGNPTDAWSYCSLPLYLQERLEKAATQRGFRNPEQLLADPPLRAAPRVTLSEVAQHHLDKAAKLQRALAPSLARQNNQALSEHEFTELGMADYAQVFGKSISNRQWRRLFKRTLDRDGGAEEFARLELYLDEHAGRADRPPPSVEAYSENGELRTVISSFKNPAAPTDAEIAYLWTRIFEHYEVHLAAGKSCKRVKRTVLELLFCAAPFLSVTRAGLRKQFERKYSAWVEGGRIPGAVKDRRADNSGRFRAPALSQADRDRIVGEAVLMHGGRVSQAWRSLRESNGLSEELLSYYLANPGSKSYVPRKIRDEVKHEIAALDDIHHGPRQAQLNGAHLSRDWSLVPAGDWYQADDVTLPIYYYEPNEEGWFTMWRGQCLVMIDLRSTRILGYVLLSSRNYNSLAIRTLITKVCDEHGLPRKGFYFERGIWKSSKILTGNAAAAPFSHAEVEGGLRDLGLRFIHARLPRAKPVEGVLGQLQNLMEGEPGYCGRDERNDKFERVQKELLQIATRRVDPRERYRSGEQWESRLDELFERYNSTTQEGKMTGGLSPDAAFMKFQAQGDPQIKFDASCRFLLAHHRRPLKVTGNGITIRIGKQAYNYRNVETGRLVGQTVHAWFNPEAPEILCVTDTKNQNPFAVELSQDVPAVDAPPERLSQEMARIAAHQSHAKAYYRVLKAKFAPQFRRNCVDLETAELGAEFQQQRETTAARQREEHGRMKTVQRISRELNMTIPAAAQRRPESLEAAERLAELLNEEDSL